MISYTTKPHPSTITTATLAPSTISIFFLSTYQLGLVECKLIYIFKQPNIKGLFIKINIINTDYLVLSVDKSENENIISLSGLSS
jgi:hypothetical protein